MESSEEEDVQIKRRKKAPVNEPEDLENDINDVPVQPRNNQLFTCSREGLDSRAHEELTIKRRMKAAPAKGGLGILEKANQEFESEDDTLDLTDLCSRKSIPCSRSPEQPVSKHDFGLKKHVLSEDSTVTELEGSSRTNEQWRRSPELQICQQTRGLRQFIQSEDSRGAELEQGPKKNKPCNGSPEPHVFQHTMTLHKFVCSEDSQIPENHTPEEAVPSSPSAFKAEVDSATKSFQSLMKEFGLSLATVTQAFLKNSGELEATKYFLKHSVRPDGYPIWTRQDDLDLENGNERLGCYLNNKFGKDNVAKRIVFLRS